MEKQWYDDVFSWTIDSLGNVAEDGDLEYTQWVATHYFKNDILDEEELYERWEKTLDIASNEQVYKDYLILRELE